MDRTYGDFIEMNDTREYLIISFSSQTLPVYERWRNNSLSANFLADYWGAFFPVADSALEAGRHDVRDAVSYIVNELLENALKYSDPESGLPIRISLYMSDDSLRFYITNSIAPLEISYFEEQITSILTRDTNELYIQRLEANAQDESGADSGLGLLTLVNDYNAGLAWKFHKGGINRDIDIVTTMVRLAVRRSRPSERGKPENYEQSGAINGN